MAKPTPLNYRLLRQKLKISSLKGNHKQKLKYFPGFIGQERALEALNFGICINSTGYNLYGMGPSGLGKHSLVKSVVDAHAKHRPVPSDWCYVYNFETTEKPLPLELPAGMGLQFQQDMRSLVEEVGNAILTVYESSEYQDEIKKINREFNRKGRAKKSIKKPPFLYKQRHEREKSYDLKMMTQVINPIMEKYKLRYKLLLNVVQYLNDMQKDILQSFNSFVSHDEETGVFSFSADDVDLIKYKVNLFVDNSQLSYAPVVFEETPTYSNLICRIEHTTKNGALVTNFTLIRPGSLHKANGGFLILEMRKLKKRKETWEALKNALFNQKIKIDRIQNLTNPVKTVSLEPLPVPLNVKVILIGDRSTYYYLAQTDPDFLELFKVPVDFEEQIQRNKKNVQLFASLISNFAEKKCLRAFHPAAVASIIDYSTRLADDVEKLSTHIRDIHDLIIEADYWAGTQKRNKVTEDDVKQAIDAQIYRMDRSREHYFEDIKRNFIIINTSGKEIGQVNCLSVRKVGNFSYGHPTRVTARVRVGKGTLIDIQREIKLAGPLHTKAGLIISNFLVSRFSPDRVVALSASISFEQIYCWTDGDSASVGELCALLSAFAEIPVQQSLAVTGSIDQYGEVQAVGGVNEKIEGFFDVCKTKGLNGKQGVLIPAVNQKNLMLKDEIVAAAKANKFFIYSISHVDEAITLLTGMPAGETNKRGEYSKNSVYYRIQQRLHKISRPAKRQRLL